VKVKRRKEGRKGRKIVKGKSDESAIWREKRYTRHV
jgi:hypothetical protein